MSTARQENICLNFCGAKDDLVYYPLRLYALRWNIETNYYKQKNILVLGEIHGTKRKQHPTSDKSPEFIACFDEDSAIS